MSRATAAQRGYNARWRRLRRVHLARQPFCARCLERGRTTLATVVDHVIPHRGDSALLYDPENLQSLCSPCHDGSKQSEERTGRPRGCTRDGVPIDPEHHWRDA